MNRTDASQLPADPKALKAMIARQWDELNQRDVQIEQRDLQIEQVNAQVAQLNDQVAQCQVVIARKEADIEQIKHEAAEREESLRQKFKAEFDALFRRFYGPRSERFDPHQLLLFGQDIMAAAADPAVVNPAALAEESGQKTPRPPRIRHKHGRARLPENLPHIRIEHDLKEEDKLCPCCSDLRVRMGEEISEQLEYIPAQFKVLEHVRFTYVCKKCSEGCEHCDSKAQIETAAKPPQPIDKGLPGPGLLAYVITSKLADHLPLYRQERIFARHDLEIDSSTMCAWMAASAMLVKPLADLMADRVRQSRVLHTDDTRLPVQAPGRCKSGRGWAYLGDRSHPYNVYQYTPDRTRAGPQGFLAEYRGYLQADAYGGYDGIYRPGNIIEVACWAHARRKYFDAQDTDQRRSVQMLEMVRRLYAVERQGEALDDEGRRELRQGLSVPILGEIRAWMDAQRPLVLPRSPIAAAIGYTLNQWEALNRYVEQGYLNIDNNAAERAMKRIAIGRKNWLFAGNDTFAGHYATLWTLIASAERHGLDPQRYLTGILARIAGTPMSQIGQFLPDVWKRDLAAESAGSEANATPTP